MADSKITGLAALTTADPANDMLPIVDVSDNSMAASGTTKRISINNILACSPSATLASATISGDLTVDTSTLKVDSANNRVGIGTASPASVLTVQSQASARLSVRTTDAVFGTVTGGNALDSLNATDTDVVPFGVRGSTITLASSVGIVHQINASGNCTWSNVGGVAGTAMTLNSTGLGVGVSPSYKLDIAGTGNFQQLRVSNANATSIGLVNTTSGLTYTLYSANTASNGFDGFGIFNGTSYDLRIVNGNVGIGVTPSVISNVIRLEIGGALSTNLTLRSSSGNASARNWMVGSNVNAFGDFVIRQGNSQGAEPNSGTDRLVIDLNGNPIFTPSSTPATLSANGQLTVNATSNTNLRFSYRGSDGVTRVANLTLA